MSRDLVVGSITVPQLATAELSQTYTPLAARTLLRLASGGGILRQAWSGKLSTDISGSGPIPTGLLSLDYAAALTLKCVGEYALTQSSNVFTGVTANRRTDSGATPYGRAYANGAWQIVTVTWGTGADVNKATLGTVSGATAYQLIIYPQLSVIADPPTQQWDWVSGDYSWSLHAEEA